MDRDAALQALQRSAARQHGLASVAAAQAAGLSRSAIRYAAQRGRVELLTPRVIRFPGSPSTDDQAVLVAVLDAGSRAWACDTTGAALWGVPGHRLAPPHIARPLGRTTRRSEGVVFHHVAGLAPRHVTVVNSIPVVRPEVVVLQLCGSTYTQRAESAMESLWRRRLVSGLSLRAILDDLGGSGRNGVCALRELLDARGDDYVPPASNLERRFASILERACLPRMRQQLDTGDDDRWIGRVDFRDQRLPLVVEVQSETFHSALLDKEHDALRLRALRDAGIEVVEVTDAEVWYDPDAVVRKVAEARARLQDRG